MTLFYEISTIPPVFLHDGRRQEAGGKGSRTPCIRLAGPGWRGTARRGRDAGNEEGLPCASSAVAPIKPAGQVGTPQAAEDVEDGAAVFRQVPEEEHPLPELLLRGAGALHRLQRVGVEARVVHFGGEGHGRGGKVLHLLQAEAEVLGLYGEGGHVLVRAAGMRGDEVRDNLLAQPCLLAYLVEELLETAELAEAGLSHQLQDGRGGVFRGHFESAADVARDELAGVFPAGFIPAGMPAAAEQEVVAHAAADEGLLHAGLRVGLAVEVEQGAVVGAEVRAGLWVDAGGPLAPAAGFLAEGVHPVHVRGGAAQVADVALEARHLRHPAHFLDDGLLAARHHGLPLVGGYGAEGAAAEAPPVEGDGELYHLEGRDAFPVVLRVGQAGVGKGIDGIQFFRGERGIRGVDGHPAATRLLEQPGGLRAVALLLDAAEVQGLLAAVGEAFPVAVQHEVAFVPPRVLEEAGGLRHVMGHLPGGHLAHAAGDFADGLLPHAIDEEVGGAVGQDAGAQAVLPIVIVGQAAHGGFDAADDDRHVRPQALEYPGVNDGGIVGALPGAPAGRVGVVVADAAVGRVAVAHRVHRACGDAEEQARPPQLAEVAEVVLPVGLGDDGHLQPLGLQHPADDGRAEGGVVHVGVAAEQYHVQLVPSPQAHFLEGRGEPVGELVSRHLSGLWAGRVNCRQLKPSS